MAYISITGFRARSPLTLPLFWWHAIASMQQARNAPGNIRTDARPIKGVYHTLSVWENRAQMRDYMLSGAHLRAMQAFPRIGTGHGFGFEAETAPAWDEVHALWLAEGARRTQLA